MNRTKIKSELDAMEVDRRQLLETLNDLKGNFISASIKENSWSIGQVLDHLLSSEEGITAYIYKKMQSPKLPSENLISRTRSQALHMLINSPIKFGATKLIANPAGDHSYDDLKVRYDKSRENLEKLIEEFPDQHIDKQIFKHPLVGRISMYHTIKFIKLHSRRHYRQIDRIIQSMNN